MVYMRALPLKRVFVFLGGGAKTSKFNQMADSVLTIVRFTRLPYERCRIHANLQIISSIWYLHITGDPWHHIHKYRRAAASSAATNQHSDTYDCTAHSNACTTYKYASPQQYTGSRCWRSPINAQ